MSGIDPLRLAQFMVLPGAAELVESFSAIPPGPLRDSIVHHARMIADSYSRTDARSIQPQPAPRLASPFAEGLSSTSAEGQIVERALRGEAPHVIAADLGLKLGLVVSLMRKARQEGGVTFPGDNDGGKSKARKPSNAKGKKLNLERFPVPDPPYWWEDPASPIWDNPAILPTIIEDPKGSMAGLGPLDRRAYSSMALAAARQGITMRDLIAQRYEMLRRIDAGELPSAIAVALRTTPDKVYGLLARVGRSRMQEMNARPLVGKPQEAPPAAAAPTLPDDSPAPPTPALAPGDAAPSSDPHGSLRLAAQKWGFTTVTRYEDMRRRVHDLRMAGWHRIQISRETGMSVDFVKIAIQHWRRNGVVFPEARFKLANKAVA